MSNNATHPLNEQVVDEWVNETTPFERVRTVMKRTYEPQTADEIAERARTTPKTARKHLRILVNDGYAEEASASGRIATLYKRANESLVLEQAQHMLTEIDVDTLVTRISEMQHQIRGFRDEYAVDSPADAVLRDTQITDESLREWQTTRRNLGFAKVALALAEADDAIDATQAA